MAAPTARNASQQNSASRPTATAVQAAAMSRRRGRTTSASSASTNRTRNGSRCCRTPPGKDAISRVSNASATGRRQSMRPRTNTPSPRNTSTVSSSTHRGRLRCTGTKGSRRRRPTAGSKSMALSMVTVGRERLMGMASRRRSNRLLTSSPPRTGNSQLIKIAT